MSAEATWTEVARRLARILHSAAAEAQRRPGGLVAERVCAWHRAIFLTMFERDAGRVRADDEPVEFGVPVRIGEELREVPIRGTLGRVAIMHELRLACEVFNASVAALRDCERSVETADGVEPAAALYSSILRTHPFVDGNLRAAYVALTVGLASVGLPAIDFRPVLDRHDECLGWAMRNDAHQTIDPLVQLIVELML
ncbi:MAG TPA: Fic family protein [Solirubrobacteraceae bacterium]|nr:Fic family protein [Solirubrobacteraceae bacterium]